jgi:hypothetical protein
MPNKKGKGDWEVVGSAPDTTTTLRQRGSKTKETKRKKLFSFFSRDEI